MIQPNDVKNELWKGIEFYGDIYELEYPRGLIGNRNNYTVIQPRKEASKCECKAM